MGQPVVHFEIGCRDRGKTATFFSQLFNWKMQEAGPATLIDTAGNGGIHGHITSLDHEPQHYVTVYVQVDDVKSLSRQGPIARRKDSRRADRDSHWHFRLVFADPDGNTIGLWKPK